MVDKAIILKTIQRLAVSYNWMFDQEQAKSNEDEARKLFSVPDFIGDMCKTLASRIRGAVAGVTFDEFHKNSARIIRGSVLGYDRATNKIKVRYRSHSILFQKNRIGNFEPSNLFFY